MRHCFIGVCCAGLLLSVSCSERETPSEVEAEWSDIQALADDASAVPMPGSRPVPEVPASGSPKEGLHPETGQLTGGEFDDFIQRLEEMKVAERKPGETLLKSKTLLLNREERFVRMDEDVVVIDDQGVLETRTLTGRFSVSNNVEFIEAEQGVSIRSGNRTGMAEKATYDYQKGVIQLDGKAWVQEDQNRLSGERIRFWLKDDRRIICEPNALLEVANTSGLIAGGESAQDSGDGTEIRSDRLVYDQSKALAEIEGNVRVRDSRGALNCNKVRLYLKDTNEIDWIEALSEVIIQTDDRKALADRATYHADEGKFTLEGEPKVQQGRSIMTGDRITFWQETRRMVCEPNARVLLYPDPETRAKFLKDLND